MDDGHTVRTAYGDVRLGSFREVLSIPGRYLNDHCLLRSRHVWHFFGIVGNAPAAGAGPGIRESETTFAHATSPDLREWRVHPEVMECSGAWPEIRNVIAPHVIEHQGIYYMLYGALDERGTQRICLATSRDLFEWERYAGNPVIVPSVSWSCWPEFGLDAPDGERSFGGCRDPHILALGDGRFVAYWVSRLQESLGTNMVCVAASFSRDLVHWQEVGPVFSMREWHCALTREVESPTVVFKDQRFWLFFKNGWWTHVVSSDSPFDFRGRQAIRLGYCHASEVFDWDGRWYITHCKTNPDDYRCAESDRTRGLFLGNLEWPDGGTPRLI